MIWEEKFTGTTLNLDYWNYDLGYFHTPDDPTSWGWGNQELQHYTAESENSRIVDNCLEIQALPDYQLFSGGHRALYS